MSVQSQFIAFHNKIKLGKRDDAYKNARAKDDSILTAVKKAFSDAGYPVIDAFLQGSLSTDTAIKHPNEDFDIDRSVVIDFENAPEDPVAPKKVVLKVLEDRGFKNAKIKKPCITADYSNLNLHIDIPVYRRDGDNYELAVGKRTSTENNKEWSPSDPKGLRDYINDSSQFIGSATDKLAQYKRLVRYIKRWRDNRFSSLVAKKAFSIGLTIMLKQKFIANFDNEGKPNDLIALRDTVEAILNGHYFYAQGNQQYRISVDMPVSPYRDIFDGSSVDTGTQMYNKLTSLKSKLNKAIDEDKLKKKCQLLNEVFGDDFEVPEEKKSSNARKSAYVSAGIVGTSQGA